MRKNSHLSGGDALCRHHAFRLIAGDNSQFACIDKQACTSPFFSIYCAYDNNPIKAHKNNAQCFKNK